MRNTRFYNIWKGIQGRCYCKSNKAFYGYGSNGIGSDWKNDFLRFKEDMYESYIEHVLKFGEQNTSIDRIDNNRNYSKENCRWATLLEQANNKGNTTYLTVNGVKKSVRTWSREKKIKYETLRARIARGWPENIIFSKPIIGRNQVFRKN